MIESFFKLKENHATVGREVVAGIVTFMTMAYIIFVNPGILSEAMGKEFFAPLVVATCLGAGTMTIAMGLCSNYPFALASGMGLNAVVAYGLILGMKLPWQTAMAVVFLEGVIISLLVLTNVREWIMNAIPMNLKRAIGVGIGIFIAFIGLKNGGIVVANPATYIGFGKVDLKMTVALFGLAVTAVLMARRIKGAILIGIALATIYAFVVGAAKLPQENMAWVTGIDASMFRTFFQLDIPSALTASLVATVFALLVSDFFDTMGTVVAVGAEAGFVDKNGRVPRLKAVLLVDSLAAVCGGLFGCSSVTTYVESAAGVGEGGRTGLTSVVVGLLFFLAIFFTPIIGLVPAQATAPALVIVGFLMLMVAKDITWDNFSESIPAYLTIVAIPFSFSIAKGIGFGFISYVLIKVFTGRYKEVHPLMYLVAALFVVDFII